MKAFMGDETRKMTAGERAPEENGAYIYRTTGPLMHHKATPLSI